MKETPQQKYQRLLHEVQELTTEVEKIKVTAVSAPQLADHSFCSRGAAPSRKREISKLWVKGVSFAELGVASLFNAVKFSLLGTEEMT